MIERINESGHRVLAKRIKVEEGTNYIDKVWTRAENNVGEISKFLYSDGVSLSYFGFEKDGFYYAGFEVDKPFKEEDHIGWFDIEIKSGEYLRSLVDEDYEITLSEMKKYARENNIQYNHVPLDRAFNGETYIYLSLSTVA